HRPQRPVSTTGGTRMSNRNAETHSSDRTTERVAQGAQWRFAMGKRVGMKQIVCGTLVLGGLAILLIGQTAFATPVVGVEPTSLAVGTFQDGLEATSVTDSHAVELRATGPTDVHILQNKVAPGGTFGWHSHPGPSIVVVQSGELTFYLADDPNCTPHI